MLTLITGERTFGSLVGVTAHETCHSWYQAVLASNESLYPWMDEGFADFTSQESMAMLFNTSVEEAHQGSYTGYFTLIKRGLNEPVSQHADHYSTNTAYTTSAYSIGTVFLHQLRYIIGDENFFKGMRLYYNTWKFKHPEPNDFIRIMERVSGLQLKWYLNYLIFTTKKIDYGIKNIIDKEGSSFIVIERIGEFPMPVEVVVTFNDGTKKMYYIPTNETIGNKPLQGKGIQREDLTAWPWVYPTYTLKVDVPGAKIVSIEVDPSLRMADVERSNNRVDLDANMKPFADPTK